MFRGSKSQPHPVPVDKPRPEGARATEPRAYTDFVLIEARQREINIKTFKRVRFTVLKTLSLL